VEENIGVEREDTIVGMEGMKGQLKERGE